jgi:hypothetical protein
MRYVVMAALLILGIASTARAANHGSGPPPLAKGVEHLPAKFQPKFVNGQWVARGLFRQSHLPASDLKVGAYVLVRGVHGMLLEKSSGADGTQSLKIQQLFHPSEIETVDVPRGFTLPAVQPEPAK